MATASVTTGETRRVEALPAPTTWSIIASTSTIVAVAGVTLVYVAASRLGLMLDAVGGFAALVWPGSGIALAAILLGGYRLWPAVAIGAFITNAWAGAPLLTALAIAMGNTAEAFLGAWLLRQVPGFSVRLERVRDVVALIVLAALLSTLVSATIGTASLTISGIIPAASFGEAWRAWWLGDAIGDMLVAPLILAWAAWPRRIPRAHRAAESISLGIVLILVALVVFGMTEQAAISQRGREYMLFPPLIWAALRFGLRGAATSTVVMTAIAVAETSLGRGPFVRSELHDSLLALQTFMGILGGTIVVLGASISERGRAARELRLARETAEAANRAKANFLGVVSHELRTPLNAITGYVDLLSMELDGPLTSKQRTVLDRIAHSQRHLLSLIEDVLSFAQAEAGRLAFALQPVQVSDCLASVASIVEQEAKRRSLKLAANECDPALRVQADPDKLRQVILNLLTNAMKFSAPGGEITLDAREAGDMIRISVTDTGIGIAREHIAKVFDPFFQVEQGGTRRFPGVGLGLSIVRDSILAMGGDVGIESVPGEGTTAYVLLPRMGAA